MIKGITVGRGLTVSGGSPSATYISPHSSHLGVGNLRWNPSGQNLEVFDGGSWITVQSSYPNIELGQEVQEILDWAREERDRQRQYRELAKTHPAVADALESVKDAELKLRELAILCQSE